MNKVLLVDDHAFLCDALAQVLEREFPAAVILQAASLDSAYRAMRLHGDIELVLLDLGLPDGCGLQALPLMRGLSLARVVVMSADARTATVQAALQSGAVGFLPKTLAAAEMLAALRHVVHGGTYLPTSGSGRWPVPSDSGRARAEVQLPLRNLSPRQTDVLHLLLQGASNKLIARSLGIGEATVKSHVTAIFACLGVATRSQVVALVGRWDVPRRAGPTNLL